MNYEERMRLARILKRARTLLGTFEKLGIRQTLLKETAEVADELNIALEDLEEK